MTMATERHTTASPIGPPIFGTPPVRNAARERSLLADRDDRVLECVHHALRDTGHLQLRTIRVTNASGEIGLDGRVTRYYLKQLAQAIVLQVAGVRGVRNELTVASNATKRVSVGPASNAPADRT